MILLTLPHAILWWNHRPQPMMKAFSPNIVTKQPSPKHHSAIKFAPLPCLNPLLLINQQAPYAPSRKPPISLSHLQSSCQSHQATQPHLDLPFLALSGSFRPFKLTLRSVWTDLSQRCDHAVNPTQTKSTPHTCHGRASQASKAVYWSARINSAFLVQLTALYAKIWPLIGILLGLLTYLKDLTVKL